MYCIWLNNHWITISLGTALTYNLLVVFFCQLCTYLTTHVDLHTSLKRLPDENDTLFKKLNCANKEAHTSLEQIYNGMHSG